MGQSLVGGAHILLNDFLALLAIAIPDGLANSLNSFLSGQNLRDREETDLHDRVHSGTHAAVTRHLIGVNHIKLRLLRDELQLYRARKVIPNFVWAERTIEKQRPAGNKGAEHVIALEEDPLVAGHEIGLGDEISGPDGLGSKA